MRATTDCIPCYLKQALSAAREVTDNPETQRRVLNEVAKLLPDLPLQNTPSENATYVLWRAHEVLECADPFAARKSQYNQLASRIYPDLKGIVQTSADPLHSAVKVAAAGNVIDLAAGNVTGLGILGGHGFDLQATVGSVLARRLALDQTELLARRLKTSTRVLYLTDNAGEIVFDKVLIEELLAAGADVVLGVKGAPILNDATVEDALEVGLDRLVPVLSNGSPMIGTDLKNCSKEFVQAFRKADIIISKGQANFETLGETSAPVFFILIAKCPDVSRELGVSMGDVVAVFNGRPGYS